MRSELLALAERVATATGPDRELDDAIYEALGAKRPCEGEYYWTAPDGLTGHYASLVPAYTVSIDAAMTLVPDGCWAEGALGRHDCTRSALEIHAPMTYDPLGHAEAATPALALTAAALRAQAAMMEETQHG